eukprot:g724.t1
MLMGPGIQLLRFASAPNARQKRSCSMGTCECICTTFIGPKWGKSGRWSRIKRKRKRKRPAVAAVAGKWRLLVGAGQGTTATHAVYESLCRMGLKAIHWQQCCNMPTSSKAFLAHRKIVGLFYTVLSDERMFVRSTRDFRPPLLDSALTRTLMPMAFRRVSVTNMVKGLLQEVLAEVHAVIDSPYPELLRHVLALQPDADVILTLRDPVQWASKRKGGGHLQAHGAPLICSPELWSATAVATPFDLLACFDSTGRMTRRQAIRRVQQVESADLSAAFTTYNNWVFIGLALSSPAKKEDFDECFAENGDKFDESTPCKFYVANARCLERRGHEADVYEANIKDCNAGLTSIVFASTNGSLELLPSVKLYQADDTAQLAKYLCEQNQRGCGDGSHAGLGRRLAQVLAHPERKSEAAHLRQYGFLAHFLVPFRGSFVGLPSVCHEQDLNEAIYELCAKALHTQAPMCTPGEFTALRSAARVWFEQECSFRRMGIWTGTDKTFLHNYHRLYEPILARYRRTLLPAAAAAAAAANASNAPAKLRMLEIGMKEGASLNLWLEYFKPGLMHISSIDIAAEPDCQPCRMGTGGGAFVFSGSQSDVPFLESVIAKSCGGMQTEEGGAGGPCFDLIIDDGGHTPFQQLTSIRTLFPQALKPGGLYVIEDIETSYWTDGHVDTGEATKFGIDHPDNAMTPLKRLVDLVNRRFFDPSFETGMGRAIDDEVESVQYYRNMVVITKKDEAASPDVAPLGEYMHRGFVEHYGPGHEAWRKGGAGAGAGAGGAGAGG